MIQFKVPVVPVAKARHRSARLPNGKVIQYVDQKSRGDIETFIAYARPHAPAEVITDALAVILMVYLPVPVSWSKKKTRAAIAEEIFPVGKPDCDNYAKFALDCMNGLFWRDDSQVIHLTVEKHYGPEPGWKIKIMQLFPI